MGSNLNFIFECGTLGCVRGLVIGGALRVSPVPYMAVYGLNQAITAVTSIALGKVKLDYMPERFKGFEKHFITLSAGVVLTAALLSKIGLITLAQAPNPILVAGALIATSLTHCAEKEHVQDPVNNKVYVVQSMPISLIRGGANGLAASAYGFNPVVFGAIGVVNSLISNSGYSVFGFVERTAGIWPQILIRETVCSVLAVSLLNCNMVGVSASIATIAASLLLTKWQNKNGA